MPGRVPGRRPRGRRARVCPPRSRHPRQARRQPRLGADFRNVPAPALGILADITGSGRKAALNPAFKWVNTTLGNIKSAITGTYRTIRDKHVPRYLAEFEYRFNRRYDLAAMMPRLGYVAVRTPPMPYRLLKLAEDYA